ncbi:MAG: hypothetical protein RSB77_00895 [Bacilli bacterium]
MKKYLGPVICSLIVGFLASKFMFNQYKYQANITSVFKNQTKLYFIRQGVYSTIDAMKENLAKFGYYIYSTTEDKYYAYIGITKDSNNLEKIKGYYKSLGYDIYVQELSVDNKDFIVILDQYDNLLNSATDNKIIAAIMENVLVEYEKRCLDGKN